MRVDWSQNLNSHAYDLDRMSDDLVAKAEEYREKLVETALEQDDDLLMAYLEGEEPSVEDLKRCIRNKEVKIEDIAEQYRMIATVTLKPQPVPLDCKIILIGTPLFYYLLLQLDPDFRKYFKVKVDFDQMMKNTWENIQQYALFIGSKCTEEKLRHFDPSAVARTIEHATRLTEDQQRLSARFLDITDLIREASFYAEREACDLVSAKHVELAIEARIYRSNKLEERIQEEIEDGSLLIDTEGAVAGQLNGLSVYQLGDYSFGKPSRVTVRRRSPEENMVKTAVMVTASTERAMRTSMRVKPPGLTPGPVNSFTAMR